MEETKYSMEVVSRQLATLHFALQELKESTTNEVRNLKAVISSQEERLKNLKDDQEDEIGRLKKRIKTLSAKNKSLKRKIDKDYDKIRSKIDKVNGNQMAMLTSIRETKFKLNLPQSENDVLILDSSDEEPARQSRFD